MKNKFILITITVAILTGIGSTIATACINNSRYNEWEDTRVIKTVTVHRGDTLDAFGYEYKPEWMDITKYRSIIMELNDTTDAALYEGQALKLYVCK